MPALPAFLDLPGLLGLGPVAFVRISRMRSVERQDALLTALQSQAGQSLMDAEETPILGRWLVTQSRGPGPATSRRLAERARTFKVG